MNTIVVAIGDRRQSGGEVTSLDVDPHLFHLSQYFDAVYLKGHADGGTYQGEYEGTYVLMGTVTDVSLAVVRSLLPHIARSLDQESIGLVVQPNTDTLVYA